MFNNIVIVTAVYLMHIFIIKLSMLLDYSINLLEFAGAC